MDETGPARNILWVEDDDQRLRAKQAEMLAIDERFSTWWLETMRKLVAAHLTDHEFTAQRMTALKGWEHDRKREQEHLHYRYDPRRRNPRLVERDIRRQQEAERAALAKWQKSRAAEEPETLSVEPAVVQHTHPAAPARKAVRDLSRIQPATVAAISASCGIATEDLPFATDAEILDAYESETGVRLDEDQAAKYLAHLTPHAS